METIAFLTGIFFGVVISVAILVILISGKNGNNNKENN